ncbi:antA/AntB antirepressor family protein [Bartonella sp. B30(2025)]
MNSYAKNKEGERCVIPKNEVEHKSGYILMVNAHAMYKFLELKQDFSSWFNDCIEEHNLKEDVHFVFTKQEDNRKKFIQNLKIETDEINNRYFTIYTARKIAKAKCYRNKNRALYQSLIFFIN